MIAFAQQSKIIDFPTQQKSNEWYTPARYIEAARAVMGGIDLDPASCELANRTVRATHYYTQADNGLVQPWYGRVWLNPPFGKINPVTGFQGSYQGLFTKRLIAEYRQGNIKQAVLLLLGNSCFNSYFTPLWDYPMCFCDGTIFFLREDGTEGHFGFGTIFVYLGNNEQTFINVFSQFGTIARRVSTPKVQPVPISLWEGVSS